MRLLLALLLLAPAAAAQVPAESGQVIGRVADAEFDIPLPNAAVWVDRQFSARTDDSGQFRVFLPVGVSQVVVRFVGYGPVAFEVEVAAPGRVVWREVRMTPQPLPCAPLCGPPPVVARGAYAARVAVPRFDWRCVETAEGQTVAIAR